MLSGGRRTAEQGLAAGLLLSVALITAGCYVPVWSETYYRPDAHGETLRSYRCGGGPDNTATFTVDDVVIGYWLMPARDGVEVLMSLEIPRSHTARMLETVVAARTLEGDSVAEFGAIRQGWQRSSGTRSETLSPQEVMRGRNREESAVKSPALFILAATVRLPIADDITVGYPRLLVDERVVERRTLRFSRKRHTQFFMPLNC